MGLNLVIFDGEDEIESVDVGGYSDFGNFRDAVTQKLEGGVTGARFPMLMLHSDCDGTWTPKDAAALEKELESISRLFKELSPIPFPSDWQKGVAEEFGLQAKSLYDCFIDVNGDPLLSRLTKLAKLSQEHNLPIIFQ
jgi:hypothetical protein